MNTKTEQQQAIRQTLSSVSTLAMGRPSRERRSAWSIIVAGTIIGYLAESRAFAYLGIIPLNIFIGEAVLGAALLSPKLAIARRWVRSARPKHPLRYVAITMAVLLC
jgi:hypothetical protein